MELKLLREIKGLTQKDLSDMYDIPMRTISSWESGERQMPKYLEKILTDKLLTMSPEEIEVEKRYVVLELDRVAGKSVIFSGSKSACSKYEDSKRKELTDEQRTTHDYSIEKYSDFLRERDKIEKMNAYFEKLSDEQKNETIKIGDKIYAKYVIDYYKNEYKKGNAGQIPKIIYGKKATYIVEEVNDIGDYTISIKGHKMYKDQSWMVGNFDYMSSINRIEEDKKMFLEIREDYTEE